MAFGFGPGTSMLKSVASNRKQLRKRNSLKENLEKYNDISDQDKSNFKKVSDEELEKFKIEFREKQKRENRTNRILILGVFLVVFIVFYFVLFVF